MTRLASVLALKSTASHWTRLRAHRPGDLLSPSLPTSPSFLHHRPVLFQNHPLSLQLLGRLEAEKLRSDTSCKMFRFSRLARRGLATVSDAPLSRKVNQNIHEQGNFIPYKKLSENLSIVRSRLNKPLTYTEKIIYSHLDDPHGQEIERGKSYLKVRLAFFRPRYMKAFLTLPPSSVLTAWPVKMPPLRWPSSSSCRPACPPLLPPRPSTATT